MARKNNKKQLITYENSIKKSNELSMAKLNKGLTLNQMQLLAYAIYCTQQKGKTEFNKADFEKMFGIEKYQTKHAREDVPKLSRLQFSLIDLENDVVDYLNVFQRIRYEKGLFTFKWADDMVPHILDLKKFNLTDLTIQSKFKSSFSWTLYDYLKGLYGHWHKLISKEALMKLFNVEEVKSYQNNTGVFRQKVLDVAIAEINQYTEIEVRYNVEKEGRAIVGFDVIWSTGTNQKSASKKQIKELDRIVDAIIQDAMIYIDLNDKKDRQRAITIVQETKEMLPFTTEPIYITEEKAHELIFEATNNLIELNNMVKKEKGRDTSFYFNWLEGEGK